MLVNKEIENELYHDAGETRVQKARLYVRTGRTKIEKINYNDENNFEITGKVTGQEIYRTHVYIEEGEVVDVTCECEDYQNRYAACKHIVATMMEFATNAKYEEMLKSKDTSDVNKALRTDSKYRSFKQIVNELYSEEMKEIEEANKQQETEKIKIEPKVIYDKYTNNLRVESRKETSVMAFEDVKDYIQGTLLQQKQNEAYTAKFKELEEKYAK